VKFIPDNNQMHTENREIISPLRVLISAYACRPGKGSEPGVGWNIVQQMATYHKVWVVTRSENRPIIEAETNLNSNLNFCYYNVPRWHRGWKWHGIASQFHYYFWQIGVLSLIRKLNREVHFDVTHHITYVRYWSPSLLSLLPVPFLWGPVGGAEYTPYGFTREFSPKGKLSNQLRNWSHCLGELDPLVRLTARTSSVSFATTNETARRLAYLGAKRITVLGESALTYEELARLGSFSFRGSAPFRFVSMGRLLDLKGFHLGLKAFAQAKLPDAEYWILGDGPQRKRLTKLAAQFHITDRVRFLGNLPREQALETLGVCHVLVHPSLHDSGGWVCLEAMAAGKPVICLDHGGPSTQVTPETGIKISVRTSQQVIRDIAEAMVRLATSRIFSESMGQCGRQRVSANFTWSHKGEVFNSIYHEISKQ
jgi:glycosyltransferase involved in cell wall biosynthesis